MATIKKEIEVARDRASIWDAVRDVGSIHKRLVRGLVVDCKLEGDVRTVTFANGMVARERIVTVDDRTFRHAWSIQGEPFTHHNGSLEVFALDGGRSRLVWIADLLPDQIAEKVAGMMEQALRAMKRTLENAD